MDKASDISLLLGLDLGPASVGWALFAQTADGSPSSLVDCGARIFDAGTEGDIESGRDASRAVPRREARSRRRLIKRKAMRKTHLFRVLEGLGLMPPLESHSPSARTKALRDLDLSLREGFLARHPELRAPQKSGVRLLPYHLRAWGLRERLEPFEFGRAIYHLVQRRGFWSNSRKAPKDKDESMVKEAIAKLRDDMGGAHLGEYLAGIGGNADGGESGRQSERRIRGRWLHRDMLKAELSALWEEQRKHHPALRDEAAFTAVRKAIVWQRPLKSAKSSVGYCTLETISDKDVVSRDSQGRMKDKRTPPRRAPLCSLEAQRFRLLTKLNNLEAVSRFGEVLKPDTVQRAALLAHLENEGNLSFAKARKIMGLNKEWEFNLERGGEAKIEGDRTSAKLRGVLGPDWDRLSLDERSRLALLVHSTNKEDVLARVAARQFALGPEQAGKLGGLRLEEGYLALSRRAVLKLMPLLEAGTPYATARKAVYGELPPPPALDELPPLARAVPGLKNPMVGRTLSEMRRVVNHICARYGKPASIRVELARDLKKSRKERLNITKNVRQREKEREAAYSDVLAEFPGLDQRKGTVVLKKLLADECRWQCPYCGDPFGAADVFGPHASVDIEHILPRSRSLDNSFLNKTLAHTACNKKKDKLTPFEAYAQSDPERYEAILNRVRTFQCDAHVKRAKLQRFQVPDMAAAFSDFTNRQLADTRYASKLALEYLGWLYGAEALRRVKASSGGVTSLVREMLHLNFILGDGAKSRADHRHHAVDAVAVACTDQGMIQRIARAAQWASERGQRLSGAPMDPPWPGFFEDVKARVLGVAVSLRHRRKVSGQLHDQTFYSGRGGSLSRRKSLDQLSAPEVERIIDPHIRALVKAKLEEIGVKDPSKAFASGANPIFLARLGGTRVRKVRISVSGSTEVVGSGERARRVMTGGNHHMAVYEGCDAKGRPVWTGDLVTLLEAKRRTGLGLPVVRRDAPELGRFLFTLTSGDIVAIADGDGEKLWRVRSVWLAEGTGRLRLSPLLDARPEKEIKTDGLNPQPRLDSLRKTGCRKVTVTPLGEIRRDNT